MLTRASALCVTLFALCCLAPCADISWSNFGPGGGGWIQSIACDPRDPKVLYVGCDVGGFYLSTDAGQSWRIQNQGLNDAFVECLAVHPEDSKVILLGMEGGVFKSTDGGSTWQWKRQGFPEPQRYAFSAPIGGLCFDPTDPNTVYAGIGRPRWQKDGKGRIYKSADCGETWALVTPEGMLPADAIICDIEVAPDGSCVLAASSRGVFRSEDDGATWTDSSSGLEHPHVLELAIAPSDPRIVYCTLQTTARDDEPWNGGVFRSDDGGKTWTRRSNGLEQRVGARDKPAPMNSIYKEIVVDPRDANVVYVGSPSWVSAGVFKSTDGGMTWARSSWHFGDRHNMDRGWITQWGPSVECLAICPADPDMLVFGTSGHVYLTEDAGETWQQRYCRQFEDGRFTGTGLEVTCMFDVVLDPVDPARGYFCFYDIGLLISDDGGKTFRRGVEGMKNSGNCFTVVVDPANRNKLWACTGQWGSNVGDVCRSADRGATWTVVGKPETGLPVGQTRSLVLDPVSPEGSRTLYVTCGGHGIFKSVDDGLTWNPINTGLPEKAVTQPCRLVMNPANPKHLRVALGGNPPSGAGIYETTDAGANWVKVSGDAPFGDTKDFVADPRDFDTLYVCQREKFERALDPPQLLPGGLFKSTDGGRTWARIHDYHFTNCVAVSPADSQVLYVGTTDHPYHDANIAQGVLKSSDGGATWQQEIEGMTWPSVSCISIDPRDPSRIFAGVGGNGGFVGIDRAIQAR